MRIALRRLMTSPIDRQRKGRSRQGYMNQPSILALRKAEVVLVVIVVVLSGFFVWTLSTIATTGLGGVDLSLRNADFPSTHISQIDVDLTSPNHWVRLVWTGQRAADQPVGPFHSSPGVGVTGIDCNDPVESNKDGSNCTPKGRFVVAALGEYLESFPECKFVTVIDFAREIALHSHWDVPDHPASHGCIRLGEYAAQLIHNNSIVGETETIVHGKWTPLHLHPLEDSGSE